MPSPTFRTRKEWFRWYSTVYLKCRHFRRLRPVVFRYRKGLCCFCGKYVRGTYHCHHGEGMYAHLGEEHRYLDRMHIAHPRCHAAHTKKERLVRSLSRLLS